MVSPNSHVQRLDTGNGLEDDCRELSNPPGSIRASFAIEKEKVQPDKGEGVVDFSEGHGLGDLEKHHEDDHEDDRENAKSVSVKIEGSTEYPHGIKLCLILLALVLSIFLASLDMTIMATAIPKITDEFHGLSLVSWYGSATFMTSGGFQTTWGKVYKYFPLKLIFLISIFVFELGSLLCAVAPNAATLIVGRAINGLGASGIGTGAYTIIAFIAPPRRRPTFTGIMGVSYGVASVAGPLVGGVFADEVSWRCCFWINLPFGGIAATILFLLFHAPNTAEPVSATLKEKLLQLDLIGAFMTMGALVSFLLAMQYGGQTKAWNSSMVVGLLVGFVLLAFSFVVWEYFQGERAMLPPRLMKKRAVFISASFIFFFGGSYYLTLYYLPIYFQSVDGSSPIMSGVKNLPLLVSVTISMILSGTIIGETGHAVSIEISGAAIATVGSGLLYTLNVGTSTGKWIAYQIIGGIGWGLAFQVPINVAQSSASDEDMSSTTAIILLFQCLGGTIFVSAAQSAFVNTIINTLPANAPGVDSTIVIDTGATQIRGMFKPEHVPGIVKSYMAGLEVAFAIVIGATGIATFIAVCNSWRRLGKATTADSNDLLAT